MYFEICKFSCWLTCQKLDTYFERCDCKVLNIYHTLQSHLEGVLPYSKDWNILKRECTYGTYGSYYALTHYTLSPVSLEFDFKDL